MVARTMTRARFSSVRLSRTGTSLEPPCEEHGTLQQVAWRITGAHILMQARTCQPKQQAC